MQIRDLMTPNVVTASAGDSVAQIARAMEERRIGAVVLTDGGKIEGIFTDRDFMYVAAKGLDPNTAPVRDHMTTGVMLIEPRDDAAEACRKMVEGRFRHLPVSEKGNLVGMISMRDLLTWAAKEMFAAEELAQVERGQEILTTALEGAEPRKL